MGFSLTQNLWCQIFLIVITTYISVQNKLVRLCDLVLIKVFTLKRNTTNFFIGPVKGKNPHTTYTWGAKKEGERGKSSKIC